MTKNQVRGNVKRRLNGVTNLSGDRVFRDITDFYAVSGALAIVEPESFADDNTEAILEVSQEFAGH